MEHLILLTVLVEAFALIATGCGGAPQLQGSHWVRKAPASASETGYVVETKDAAAVEQLLEKNNATGRVLDAQDGRYELFNISAAAISAALPQARIRKNVFIANALPPAGKISQSTNEPPKNPKCRDPKTPEEKFQFDVSATNHVQELSEKKRVISISDPHITFAAATNAIEVMWLVYGPEGLQANDTLFKGMTLDFDANLPGSYTIMARARNAAGICQIASGTFGVTWPKVAYLGPSTTALPVPTAEAYSTFAHLMTVGALNAWTKAKGDRVKIAIVDSGVNYNHPDLRPNIAVTQSELIPNGKDNDLNGFINDAYGWDFVNGDNLPYDDNGHGTHVAGLAAGARFGIAPHASILPVKVATAVGEVDGASLESGIYYAIKSGANIINISIGAPGELLAFENEAIHMAESRGILVVVAALNDGKDNDLSPVYPANLATVDSNVISVAATTLEGALTQYSNFGLNNVTMAAPGGGDDMKIDGLLGPDFRKAASGGYTRMSGTSMASPVVAGVAALVKSADPYLSPRQLKRVIMGTGTFSPALSGKLMVPEVVNAAAAVNRAQFHVEGGQ